MTSPRIEVILGPPGTGKTTTLINEVAEYLARGIKPWEIAYLAFTKKAAEEAMTRAMEKFPQYTRRDFRYFRTLHSFCFRQLGLTRQRVMQRHHYTELGDLLGIEVRGTLSNYSDEGFQEAAVGDKAIFIENVARNRCVLLQDEWQRVDNLDLSFEELDRFSRALQQYKANRLLVDYTDMLSQFLDYGIIPNLKVLIIDEAQDLSNLQWRIVNVIKERRACDVLACGDDDQAIYKWAGAAGSAMQGFLGSYRVLGQSYRVPRNVKSIADGIIRNAVRSAKQWVPDRRDGRAEFCTELDDISIGSGTYYLLCRNLTGLRGFEDLCRRLGVPYETANGRRGVERQAVEAILAWTRHQKGGDLNDDEARLIALYRSPRAPSRGIWHDCLDLITVEDREYYISCLRRGEDLRADPRVRISTIHGVKGGEADHVVIRTDMTRQTYDGYVNDPDDEARVFYVGVTRAKESVTIVSPESNLWFQV